MQTRIISVLNQKGGSGKTTTAVNVASGWARLLAQKDGGDRPRVLLIDIDPQASATSVILGLETAVGPRRRGDPNIYELLLQRADFEDAVRAVSLEPAEHLPGALLDIVPSHLELFKAENELISVYKRETQLRKALNAAQMSYDVIIIDCPPSLGVLTLNALATSTEVLIPVDPGVFPLIGLNMLKDIIHMIQEDNTVLRIAGVIPTMQDRTVLSRDTVDQLVAGFGDLVLEPVPRRVAVGEAHAEGVDLYISAPDSDAAEAYLTITRKLMNHE
jgi:chromosome partitioning protein